MNYTSEKLTKLLILKSVERIKDVGTKEKIIKGKYLSG